MCLGELDTKEETLFCLDENQKGVGFLGLCSQRGENEPWASSKLLEERALPAREAGTAKPSRLKGGENILAELKKAALQKGDGEFGPLTSAKSSSACCFRLRTGRRGNAGCRAVKQKPQVLLKQEPNQAKNY